MALEVVGAGFGRTGTLSLKHALERLGLERCYHMMEVRQHPEHRALWAAAHRGEPVDWDSLFEGYRASVDWPSCNLWRELAEYYQQSKVLLSSRDPERWYASVRNTIYQTSMEALHSNDADEHARGLWVNEIIWEGVFDGRLEDQAYAIDVYERHNADVRASVPPARFLEFDPGDGWEPLCAFLGRPVPDEAYPHVNSTEDFLARRRSSS